MRAALVLLMFGFGICSSSVCAHATQARSVPIPEDPGPSPQLQIDGVGIGTLNFGNPSETSPAGTSRKYRAGVDFGDSALSFGAAQKLFQNDGVGSVRLGFLALDDTVSGKGNPFFLHQAFVNYQTEKTEWLIGRADDPISHLVDFPTLREEDLVTLTSPLNPRSSGDNREEHRYSNLASFTLNQNQTYYENFHVQHLIDSRVGGTGATGVNSFGLVAEYLCPPGREAFDRLVSFGAGFEHRILDAAASSGLNVFVAGGAINLNPSATHRVDFRLQEIVSLGSDRRSFSNLTETFQSSYQAIVASLRYLQSPFGQAGAELALTGGYQSYFKVQSASAWSLALTAVRKMSPGFDLVSQLKAQWRETALAAPMAGQRFETLMEVGFVFNFGSTINPHISPRRSLLNVQHQYIPN